MRRNRRSLNLPASVREQLRNVAKELGLDFEPVLIRYAVERLLYRLAVSRQGNQFVVKGAMLFVLWDNNLYRPTRDVDLLGFGRRDPERLARVFREVCEEEVGEVIGDFLRPVLKAVSSGMLTDMRWPAGGPWESPTTK